MTDEEKLALIADLDALFDGATEWGSWMVSAANHRERLVNELNKCGHNIPHKNLARTSSGGRVS